FWGGGRGRYLALCPKPTPGMYAPTPTSFHPTYQELGMKLSRSAAALLACVMAVAPSRAEWITYTFGGTDTAAGGNVPVSGSLTYETPGTLLAPVSLGTGNTFSTAGSITLTQDNQTFSTDPSVPLFVTLTTTSVIFTNPLPGAANISL